MSATVGNLQEVDFNALAPAIKSAIEKVENAMAGDNTQRSLERLQRCQACGTVIASFGEYRPAYGCSIDSAHFSCFFSSEGTSLQSHDCEAGLTCFYCAVVDKNTQTYIHSELRPVRIHLVFESESGVRSDEVRGRKGPFNAYYCRTHFNRAEPVQPPLQSFIAPGSTCVECTIEPTIKHVHCFRAPKGQFQVICSDYKNVSPDYAAVHGREHTEATVSSLEEARAIADARVEEDMPMFIYDDEGQQLYAVWHKK